VRRGHGGIGENGRIKPTAARPKHPTISQRNGATGNCIIEAKRERDGAHSEE